MTSVNLTPTRQELAGYTSAAVVEVLESTWAAVRRYHPEIPAVVLVLGPAKGRWGHFSAGRWQHGEGRHPEVLVAAEGLRRTADEVLTTLLHEAAHGLAHSRGIEDTSRNGRYHNKKFAAVAAELGLDAEQVRYHGWTRCTLRPETGHRYQNELAKLATAMTAFRHGDQTGTRRPSSSVTARCACPRMIRVTRSVLDAGPILCGLCRAPFRIEVSL